MVAASCHPLHHHARELFGERWAFTEEFSIMCGEPYAGARFAGYTVSSLVR